MYAGFFNFVDIKSILKNLTMLTEKIQKTL